MPNTSEKEFTLKTIPSLLIAASFIFTASTGFAAGDAKKGKAFYTTCVACHGDKGQGNKALNSPRIAGQETWYVVRQLKNFKAGIRGTHAKDIYGQQMRPMAMTLPNDQAIEDVAAYIATLK